MVLVDLQGSGGVEWSAHDSMEIVMGDGQENFLYIN